MFTDNDKKKERKCGKQGTSRMWERKTRQQKLEIVCALIIDMCIHIHRESLKHSRAYIMYEEVLSACGI